ADGAATNIPNQLIATYKDSKAFQGASLPAAAGARVLKEHQFANSRLLQVSDVAIAKKVLSVDANVAPTIRDQYTGGGLGAQHVYPVNCWGQSEREQRMMS